MFIRNIINIINIIVKNVNRKHFKSLRFWNSKFNNFKLGGMKRRRLDKNYNPFNEEILIAVIKRTLFQTFDRFKFILIIDKQMYE